MAVLKTELFDGGADGDTVTGTNTSADVLSFGTGNTFTLDPSYRVGSTGRGLKVVTAGTSTGYIEFGHATGSTPRIVTRIRKFRITSAAHTSDIRVIGIRSTTAVLGYLCVSPSLSITLRNAAGAFATGSTSTNPIALNTDYDLEIAVTPGTTTTDGTLGWAIYPHGSTTPIETRTVTGVNAGTTTPAIVRLGTNAVVGGAATFYLDELSVNNKPTGWISDTAAASAAALTGVYVVWEKNGVYEARPSADENILVFWVGVDQPSIAAQASDGRVINVHLPVPADS